MILPVVVAAAPAPAPPVEIRYCQLANPVSFTPMVPAGIRVIFVDRKNVAATEVSFTINYYYHYEDVSVRGTFSPNVSIQHIFPQVITGELYAPNNIRCALREVRFSDGTVQRFGENEYVVPNY
jgi:hypothetical protein